MDMTNPANTPRPSVHGILETALYVEDLQRSAAFYEELFGFDRILDSERLVTLRVSTDQVLLLFRRGSAGALDDSAGIEADHDGRGRLHLAFRIEPADADGWMELLESRNLDVGRKEWPQGGSSLFFRDPDGHLVELAPAAIWGDS